MYTRHLTSMDMYEKLSRALMRRKYERVGRGGRGHGEDGAFDERIGRKPVTTVKIAKAVKGKNVVTRAAEMEPSPVLVPKKFTILSSSNDVIDEDWLNQALRRTLAEGTLNIIKPSPSERL